MADIIDFKRPTPERGVPSEETNNEAYNWRCNCGNLTFYLEDDDSIQCAACMNYCTESIGGWRTRSKAKLIHVPDPTPENTVDADGVDDKRFVSLDDMNFAFKHALRADPKTVKVLILCKDNGSVQTWGDEFSTEEQIAWLEEKLQMARELLTARSRKPG